MRGREGEAVYEKKERKPLRKGILGILGIFYGHYLGLFDYFLGNMCRV